MTKPLSKFWQPIATAPNDEDVLVFSQRWGVIVATFRPEFGVWFPRVQCPAALGADDASLITHWMPLPSAPEVSPDVRTPSASATGLPPTLARFLNRALERNAA